METYERFIKNRVGRRPVVVNVNKKLNQNQLGVVYDYSNWKYRMQKIDEMPAWRATIYGNMGIVQGRGVTKNAALIDLAKQIENYARKDFTAPPECRKKKQRKHRTYTYKGNGYKVKNTA